MEKVFKYITTLLLVVGIISILGIGITYVSWSFDRMTWDFTQWPYEARRGMADSIIGWPVGTGLFAGMILMLIAISDDDI